MNDILGFMLDGDYDAFNWIADNFLGYPQVNIIEIGTLFGKSAIAIDDVFIERNINHNIMTFDGCFGFLGEDGVKGVAECRCDSDTQYERIKQNLTDRNNIKFVRKFWQPDSKINFEPDFVFYDGVHNYEESVKILNWKSPNIIAIDDYQYDGVKKAVDEHVKSTGKRFKKFDDSKIAIVS